MGQIQFHTLIKTPLKNRTRLKAFINELFHQEDTPLKKLHYIFCDDEYLLDINRRHLNHDYYTDIITFDLSEHPDDPVTGELYISVDRVKDNAEKLSEPIERELHRVIFHGALHLCGLRDKTHEEEKEMRKAEEKYLKQYFG